MHKIEAVMCIFIGLILYSATNLQVRLAVDKVILAESADRKQQLASWVADKKIISAHAMDRSTKTMLSSRKGPNPRHSN